MSAQSSAVVSRPNQRNLTIVVLLTFGFGCSRSNPAVDRVSSQRHWSDPEVVAQVGDSRITVSALRRATTNSGDAVASSLRRLIDVRAYGRYAERGGLEQGRRQMVVRTVLARAILERIEAQAKTPATPTNAEVEAMTEKRWIEFNRPEAMRTCHALVQAERLDPTTGSSLAQRLANALRPLARCEDFLERAKAFPSNGAKIVAENLPPVTSDGRTLVLNGDGTPVDEGPTFDVEFARAAHQIKSVGLQSDVVRTRFGWHIILLEAKVPAKLVSFEERRSALAPDILLQRARDMAEQHVIEARQRTPIAVDRAAIDAVGHVQVSP